MVAPQATNLADKFKKMAAEATQNMENAQQRMAGSFDKLNSATQQINNAAATVDKAADEILASLGQFSNMPPQE